MVNRVGRGGWGLVKGEERGCRHVGSRAGWPWVGEERNYRAKKGPIMELG